MNSITIMTDLEGVAGVTSFEDHAESTGRYYERACRLLTAEVNAAVEAAVACKVTDIVVCDGHGAGGIWYEDLHPAARLIHGRPITLSALLGTIPDTDAVAIMGQHAMAGVADSNMNHTQSSSMVDYYKLNGVLIGETAQIALYAGSFDKPVIFFSGEQAACREMNDLVPQAVAVSVKQGLGRGAAISLSAQHARQRIHDGMTQAIEQHRTNPVLPYKVPGPYVLEKRFFHTHIVDQWATLAGVERVDSQTIRIRSDDIRTLIYR